MLFLKFAKRIDFKCSHHKKKVSEIIFMLITLDLAILQCMYISKQHGVHDKYIQFLIFKIKSCLQ